jgi:hypothetical protein
MGDHSPGFDLGAIGREVDDLKLIADVALDLGNRASRPVVNQPKLDPRGSCKQ